MRLDKYLSVVRIFKSRSLAGEAASSNMVYVDGLPAKSSREIKTGAIIEIDTPIFYKKIEVIELPSGNVDKKTASRMYSVLQERKKD